jgi:hypothetical protein
VVNGQLTPAAPTTTTIAPTGAPAGADMKSGDSE